MAESSIVVSRRFTGMPNFVQGGYVGGVVASRVPGPAEVSFRLPTPVEKPLRLREEGGSVQLLDADQLLVEGKSAELTLDVPPVPDWETCRQASASFPGLRLHPSRTCFVCGTQVPAGEGLHIYPGPVANSPLFATTWTPEAARATDEGRVPVEVVWAVMDCMSGWPVFVQLATPAAGMLMGRFIGHVRQAAASGQRCRLIGWLTRFEGRKYFSGMAMVSEAGDILAFGQATWIALKPRA